MGVVIFFLHLHRTLLVLVHADAGRHARVGADHGARIDCRIAQAVVVGRYGRVERRIGRH